jgi:hypothetical protein
MEIVEGTTHTHPEHGGVRIESIYREFGIIETSDRTGHIPGGWYIKFETGDGNMLVEPLEEFVG